MTAPIITLMDAYMLERLLARGISKESLVQSIHAHTLNQYNGTEHSFDYSELDTAVDGKESIYGEAILDGYAVSYMTINGLKNLLKMKFGFLENKDYTPYEAKLEKLVVIPIQLEVINKMIGRVWTVQITNEASAETIEISIKHVSLV